MLGNNEESTIIKKNTAGKDISYFISLHETVLQKKVQTLQSAAKTCPLQITLSINTRG